MEFVCVDGSEIMQGVCVNKFVRVGVLVSVWLVN